MVSVREGIETTETQTTENQVQENRNSWAGQQAKEPPLYFHAYWVSQSECRF